MVRLSRSESRLRSGIKKMRDPLGEGRDYGLVKPKKNSVMRRLSVRR